MMPKSPPRPALTVFVVLLLAAATVGATTLREPSTANGLDVPEHPIVQRAWRDLGSYQGQCWIWVQEVVRDATGRTMGFGYRDGFFEAGAYEVPIAEAAPGDVIQLADDLNAGPGVDYFGLHTAIIVSVDGPGTFTVIDSNSQWDGIVRTRSPYDPAASADRYSWISFHVYRFPLDPGLEPPPSPTPFPLPDGDSARVDADGDCLNLRSTPTTVGGRTNIVDCLADGSEIVALGPIADADGYTWLQVATRSGVGWVAKEFVAVEPGADPESPPVPVTEPPLGFKTFVGPLSTS